MTLDRRHLAIVGALLVLALVLYALLAARTASAPKAGEGTEAAMEGGDPAAPLPPPEIAGLAKAAPSAPARTTPRARQAETRTIRVTGRAVAADGLSLDGAEAIAWADGVPAVRGPVAADGSFDLSLAGFPKASWPTAHVAVVVPDGPVVVADVRDETATRILVILPRAGASPLGEANGVLVDPDGKPLPGETLLLRNQNLLNLQRRIAEIDEVDLVRSLTAGITLWGVSTTDGEGRFRFHGFQAAPREVVIASKRWLVTGDPTIRPGPDAHVVRATPAYAVEGTVVDEESGAPLERFGVRIAGWGLAGRDGRFGVVLPWPGEREAAFDETVLLEADGYEPAKAAVRVAADRTSSPVEVRMVRLTAYSKAGVSWEIVDRDPVFVARPFDVELRDPVSGDQRRRQATERIDATHVRATVPAGRWRVRLRPSDGWSNSVYWDGVLELPEGKETSVRWIVPPHGAARFLLPSSGETSRRGVLDAMPVGNPSEGARTHLPAMGIATPEVKAMTVGEWVAEYEGRRTTFTVRAGETVEVDLTRE